MSLGNKNRIGEFMKKLLIVASLIAITMPAQAGGPPKPPFAPKVMHGTSITMITIKFTNNTPNDYQLTIVPCSKSELSESLTIKSGKSTTAKVRGMCIITGITLKNSATQEVTQISNSDYASYLSAGNIVLKNGKPTIEWS